MTIWNYWGAKHTVPVKAAWIPNDSKLSKHVLRPFIWSYCIPPYHSSTSYSKHLDFGNFEISSNSICMYIIGTCHHCLNHDSWVPVHCMYIICLISITCSVAYGWALEMNQIVTDNKGATATFGGHCWCTFCLHWYKQAQQMHRISS